MKKSSGFDTKVVREGLNIKLILNKTCKVRNYLKDKNWGEEFSGRGGNHLQKSVAAFVLICGPRS